MNSTEITLIEPFSDYICKYIKLFCEPYKFSANFLVIIEILKMIYLFNV